MIHLDYRDSRPIYIQIEDGIREQIRGGVLRGGERLPSVRELATALTINPNTIQRAYRELENTGWIVSVAGKGSFVAQGRQPDQEALLLESLDKTVAALEALGVSRESLVARLQQGGKHHA